MSKTYIKGAKCISHGLRYSCISIEKPSRFDGYYRRLAPAIGRHALPFINSANSSNFWVR